MIEWEQTGAWVKTEVGNFDAVVRSDEYGNGQVDITEVEYDEDGVRNGDVEESNNWFTGRITCETTIEAMEKGKAIAIAMHRIFVPEAF